MQIILIVDGKVDTFENTGKLLDYVVGLLRAGYKTPVTPEPAKDKGEREPRKIYPSQQKKVDETIAKITEGSIPVKENGTVNEFDMPPLKKGFFPGMFKGQDANA